MRAASVISDVRTSEVQVGLPRVPLLPRQSRRHLWTDPGARPVSDAPEEEEDS